MVRPHIRKGAKPWPVKDKRFNELCKDIMIANMADTLKALRRLPGTGKQVYDLKACTVMESPARYPLYKNVVISAVEVKQL